MQIKAFWEMIFVMLMVIAPVARAQFELALILHREGDYRDAAEAYRQAIKQSGGRFPVSHNNLGIVLAVLGDWDEAEREFDIATAQSKGRLAEAAHNLKLCRSL